jgi:hypothetical protein
MRGAPSPYGALWWIFRKSAVASKFTVSLSKFAFPGRKSQIADRKIADKLYCKSYENFQSPGFPHNFSKNYRLQLKFAVWTRLDVSYNL